MKAILFRTHGGPEVLEYTDAPKPPLRANEVLVRMRACALNHLALWVRGGLPTKITMPHIDLLATWPRNRNRHRRATVKVGQKVSSPRNLLRKMRGLPGRSRQLLPPITNLGYMIDGARQIRKMPGTACPP
jgi:hypothetical protein